MAEEFEAWPERDLSLAGGVRRLDFRLASEPGFLPGQYLFVCAAGREIPFSIGSSPGALPELTLFYKSEPGNPDALIIDALRAEAGAPWSLRLPYGKTCLNPGLEEPDSLLLIASGTAFSQAHSICQALAERRSAIPITLCRLIRHPEELWNTVEMRHWPDLLPGLRCLNIPHPDVENKPLPQTDADSLAPDSGRRAIIGGSLATVQKVAVELLARGWDRSCIASDMFESDNLLPTLPA